MQQYNFIGVLGISPQVITEAIWSFQRQSYPPLFPAEVHLLTTAVGEAFFRALCFGERCFNPQNGMLIPNAKDRWTPFCETILEGHRPKVFVHRTDVFDEALQDIRDVQDDMTFANLCYEKVAQLMEKELPVFGCIAGGRKTMSAHLMTAFSVYARPQDKLVHVLLSPPHLEANHEFFYPTPKFPEARLERVSVTFPRLFAILQETSPMDSEQKDLHTLLGKIDPYWKVKEPASNLTIFWNESGSVISFKNQAGMSIDELTLTPLDSITLVILLLKTHPNSFLFESNRCIQNPKTEMLRNDLRVYGTGNTSPLKPWKEPLDFQKALSRLKNSISQIPLGKTMFQWQLVSEGSYELVSKYLPLLTMIFPKKDLPEPLKASLETTFTLLAWEDLQNQ